MMNSMSEMLSLLLQGKHELGFLAVKAEFEAEGARSEEVIWLAELARRAGIGLAIKVGGCEAIRDLIDCRQFSADYVIAPMIESKFALQKFILARNRVYSNGYGANQRFLINIETITALGNLPELVALAGAEGIGLVFGRADFAASLGCDRSVVNSAMMLDHLRSVAYAAREHDVDMVVGGSVDRASIATLKRVREVRLDRFETRKVVFDAAVFDDGRVEAGLELAVAFELLWLKSKRNHYRAVSHEDEQRIAMIETRQQANLPRNDA